MKKKVISFIFANLIAHTAYAGVASSMQNFWNDMGGYSNVNSADAYQLQSAGYYTLGGIHARTPVKNTQVMSLSLPSMKAGCGGINLYNGGMSFINASELTQTLKSIANNSSAFAMQLALETISPVIAEKVEELQTWIQRINAMNINSCETAASLVGGMWPRHEQASKTICSTLAGSNGIASDYTAARHKCYTERGATSDSIHKTGDSADQLMVEDINLAWKAIQKSNLFKEEDLAEVLMTLSGTIIIHAPKDENDQPKFEYISGKASNNDLITVLLDGGDISYHTCIDKDKCLNVVQNGGKHNIDDKTAFKARVEKLILDIIDKIKTDKQLSAPEIEFLNNKANLPLYKILNVYAAYSGAGAMIELPVYTEAIALQMLFEYLDDLLRQVEVASDTLMIASEDHTKRFKDDIREARKSLAQRELKTHQNYSTLMSLVDRAMVIEGVLAKNIGSPIADAFQWQKGL